MKQFLSVLCLSTLLLPGLSSCTKMDKNDNAYKVMGAWTPERYELRYTDFNGDSVVYEATSFGKDIWEFRKRGKLLIHLGTPDAGPYSYKYSVNDAVLDIGNQKYTITQVDDKHLKYYRISPPNDTARLQGQALGIVYYQEWHFSK